jgi:hypothetical protein
MKPYLVCLICGGAHGNSECMTRTGDDVMLPHAARPLMISDFERIVGRPPTESEITRNNLQTPESLFGRTVTAIGRDLNTCIACGLPMGEVHVCEVAPVISAAQFEGIYASALDTTTQEAVARIDGDTIHVYRAPILPQRVLREFPPNPDIVRLLEQLLDKAKSGKLTGIAVATVTHDDLVPAGEVDHSWCHGGGVGWGLDRAIGRLKFFWDKYTHEG